MNTNYNDFIHPSDKKALDALKAVPGFDLVLKKFMNIVGEKMFQIEMTSSYLKLGPDQMPEIYEILVKVCAKLKIEVPALYLALNRAPNAYTYGDKEIFIVINSGLIETMTHDQIETVLAHECGHIVCNHVLYHTMGRFILTGAELFANDVVSKAIVISLQYAFYYWMRCSEFSADRVAAHYHESSDPVVDLTMALSGATHNLNYNFSREAFLKQAQNYQVLIDNSTYNKVLEFIQIDMTDYPLNACRAYEINEFYKKYTYNLLPSPDGANASNDTNPIYNLRIRYEFIKPKTFKFGDIFKNNRLEIMIGDNKCYIDKNETKDLRLEYGEYFMNVKNLDKEDRHYFILRRDTEIVVSWDSVEEKFTIKGDN